MRKKFTMLLASLFLVMGTAWAAETATTHADGLYKIHWEWNGRGYLAYHDTEYPNSPQLAGVVNHNPNGHYQLTDAGISLGWYLYTSPKTGKSYLFEATTGKFITFNPAEFTAAAGSKECLLSEEVSYYAMLNLLATDNESAPAFALRYVHNGTNYQFCSGCGSNKGQYPVRFATNGQSDGGIPFKFVEDNTLTIDEDVKNAAIAKITEHETYSPVHTETRTRKDRQVVMVSLNSGVFSSSTEANNTALTHQEYGLQYINLTKSVTMKALAGETVTATITLEDDSKWTNGYLYIDAASDGFTASVDDDDFTPLGDLRTFTYYKGKDSQGGTNEGNHGTNLAMPSFSMPTEAGTYRMRFKTDWDNIMPDGGKDLNSDQNQFVSAGGTIVDVMLEVVALEADAFILSAPAGCEVTYNGNTYTGGASFVPVGELSASDFSVSERAGYTAVVTIDNGNKTVAITYDPNLQVGDKLILRNRQHNVYMGVMLEGGELDGDPAPTTKKLASTSAFNYKNCWELVAATYNETSCFYLYNPYYDWYASPISARNGAVLLSKNTDDAGCYQFEKQGDYVVIKCLNGANTGHVYLHQVSHDNNQIVDWDAGSEASQWSFELVSEDTENAWVTTVSTELETSKTTLQSRTLGSAIGLYSGMTDDEKTALITNSVIPAEGTAVEKIKAGVYAQYNLQNAINKLTLNVPEKGKYYRLQNESSSNYMSGNKDNITLLTDGAEKVSTIFYLDNNNALRATNGKYLDCSAKNYSVDAKSGAFGPAYQGPKEGIITYKNNGCWTYGAGTNNAGLDKMTGGTPNHLGYNWRITEVAAEDVTKYEEMKTLSTSLSTFMTKASGDLGVISLQTLYNTAAGYLSSCGSADGNVESKMIDGDNNTFYASPWNSSVDGIDYHYWQVDLGEGVSLSEFIFSYVTRSNGNNTPYTLDIKGSADGATFTSLTTITEGLPQTASASYTSSVISNPNNYRYIRFEATDAKTNAGQNDGYAAGGHATQKTIAIAEFSIKRTGSALASVDNAVTNAVTAAQTALDGVYSQSVTNAAASINTAHTTLEDAYTAMKMYNVTKPTYPFTLTTDNANPVLYAIKSGRTNQSKEWWYTYDSSDQMIALTQYTGENTQMWFFKEVITEDYKYALQLYPAAAATKAMSYQNTNSDKNKIVAQDPGTVGWTNYWLLATTNGNAPYGLQTYNQENYLSNNGGVVDNAGNLTNYKMGMWNAAPSSDGGTAMYFSTPSQLLKDLIDSATEMAQGEGTTVGYYTAASVTALESAITEAEGRLSAGNYSVTELNEAIAQLEVILPQSNCYYQIVSGLQAFSETKAIYSTGEALAWKSFDGTDKTFYWTIVPNNEGQFTLQNVGDEKYINGLTMSAEEVTNTTLKFLAPGQFNIISNGNTFHANNHYSGSGTSGAIINHGGSANSPSAWKIIEVEHPDLAVAKARLQNRVTELNAIIANMGSAIGQNKEENKAELQGHVATAQGVLDRGSKIPGDYTAALTTLNEAIEGFDYSLILPEAGKYYQIHSSWTAFGSEEYDTRAVYSTTDSYVSWKVLDNADKSFYWKAEAVAGGFVFKNYNNDKYMVGKSANETHWTVEDASTNATLGVKILSNEAGAKGFEYAIVWGTRHMHTGGHGEGANKNGRIVSWETNAANSGSSWYIVEIENPDLMIARAAFEAAVDEATARFACISDMPGYYSCTQENATKFSEIDQWNYENATVEEFETKTAELEEILDAFTINLPKQGKFYRFKHPTEDVYMLSNVTTVNGNKRLAMGELDGNEVASIFYQDGNTLLSYAIGQYLSTAPTDATTDWTCLAVGAEAPVVTYGAGTVLGTLGFYLGSDNTRAYNSGNYSDGYVNAGGSIAANAGYDWEVVEVTTLPVTVTSAGYATLYAPVALNIPADVTIYVGVKEDNYLDLTDITTLVNGNVIPANTGVIIKANQGTYNFTVADDVAALDASKNLLTGKYPKSEKNASKKVYTLQNGTNGVGFYLFNGTDGTNTTYINGFRAWVELEPSAPANALRIRFAGTTGIEDSTLNPQSSTEVYDLMGRRVLNPTKGMYIVNGKKMVIK